MNLQYFEKSGTIKWLLEKDNPSVRYFTLRDILDIPENDIEVKKAKNEIMNKGLVPEILDIMKRPEYVEKYHRFYTYKYKGLVWSLITLAELGASMTNQVKEYCEYILENSQEREDGGFSQNIAKKIGGGRTTEVIPCLTGNMVWSLIRFGYLEDSRLQKSIDWITDFTCLNDGVEINPQVSPYNHYDMCWGKHTCHMGVVKSLKALEAIPTEYRSEKVVNVIEQAVEFILKHHIYKCSHNLNKKSKPGWLRLGFPLMYQTDILEILDILTGLEVKDKRMVDAIQIIMKKQNDVGRWVAENTYNSDRLLIPISEKGVESKWLTFKAIRMIKRVNE